MVVKFNDNQFDALFPFNILMSQDMVVESNGSTLEKIFPGTSKKPFLDNYIIKRPIMPVIDARALHSLIKQLVIIECRNDDKTTLRGQMEWLPETKQFLFIGSPWFSSMEQIIEKNLSVDDFAIHDPLIDLLHLLKTQEITTEDLKHLLSTVNKQKNELKVAAKEIQDIALFPMQNPDPLIRIDSNGNILKENPAAEKFTEFTYKETRYSKQDFWKKIASMLDKNAEREVVEACFDYKTYSFVIKSLPEFGYYNVYGRDITAQKRNEEQLNILSSIAAENTNGVVISDKYGKVEWVNKSFERITGYALEEVKGTSPGKMLQGKDTNPETVAYLRNQIHAGDPFGCEILNYHKTGRPYWLRIQGQALKDSDGKIVKYFAIQEDITENKRLEVDLVEAKEIAEQSLQAKEIFLANMSHEIRTPLNAIMGMATLMETPDMKSEQKQYLDAISKSSQNLLVIINDILDFSKIEAGELSIEKVGIRMRDIIANVIATMNFKAEEKGIRLTHDIDKNIPEIVIGDSVRINQILMNLVSNAIKFTNTGFVHISCRDKTVNEKQSCTIELSVEDSGSGINQDQLDSIFESFKQEDTSVSRKHGGTGLGLSIVKQLSELMGGTVTVSSEKGSGSRFMVTIPFKVGSVADLPEDNTREVNPRVLAGTKVLLVDDHEVNRFLIVSFFKEWNIYVEEAENGQEAIDMLRENTYDLVLMDKQMPVLDGIEATQIIRAQVNKEIPIIALSANALKETVDSCLNAGMDDFVAKPFKPNELFAKMITLLGVEEVDLELDSVAVEQPVDAPKTCSYDLSALADLVNNDKEQLKIMLGMFTDSAPQDLLDISRNTQKLDFVKVGAIVHKMKPSIMLMNMAEVVPLIPELENNKNFANEELIQKSEKFVTLLSDILDEIRLIEF